MSEVTPKDIRAKLELFFLGRPMVQRDAYIAAFDAMAEKAKLLKDAAKLIKYQDKLLCVYRLGGAPGKWLNEMEPLRKKLAKEIEAVSK